RIGGLFVDRDECCHKSLLVLWLTLESGGTGMASAWNEISDLTSRLRQLARVRQHARHQQHRYGLPN
ncbi:MAG TPA: hypothetical protein VLZ55_09635, partial [Rhodanobacter sp.]|nr:hypothetical protein [Rhodanobacter sp.]